MDEHNLHDNLLLFICSGTSKASTTPIQKRFWLEGFVSPQLGAYMRWMRKNTE